MRIYTKKGDDGTTGLYHGGRVRKDDPAPSAYGDVDEAQSFMGLARAEAERGGELDQLLIALEKDLWVLMADLATEPEKRHTLKAGSSLVTADMVEALERHIDAITPRFPELKDFTIPGQNRQSALLDVARPVVRRAERSSLAAAAPGSLVIAYLNRLSDLLWTMARWQEGVALQARDA
jgi:cob(I)alamin adenosyltransferase